MKKSILLFALFAIIFKSNAYVVSSTNGYDVNIEINLNSLSVSSGCSGGWYNYGISYSYDISFSGANAPQSLWTLQATTVGQDGSTFMSLPNSGGEGTNTSSTVSRSFSDCETATPSSLGFDTIYLKIQGPGIPNQTIPLHTTALPVTLLHFNANTTDSHVLLNWATASELNNDYFTIEMSEDGVNFSATTTITGAGTTNDMQHYEAIELLPSNTTYYRLKQTDFDGTYTYSSVIVVDPVSSGLDPLSVYPNPNASGPIKVNVGSKYRTTLITVRNLNGQVLQEIAPTSEISTLQALPRGMYFVDVVNNATGDKQSLRLIQE